MELSKEESILRAKEIIGDATKIVALLGVGTVMECGAINYLNNQVIYRIEDTYHRSPEEIMSTGFYSSRPDQFYKYYKEEYLADHCTPGKTYDALKKLDDAGVLTACITTNTHGLEKIVGIHKVVELYGSRHFNYCSNTSCYKRFPLEYVEKSKGVPVCDVCHSPIRPGVRLYGERIDNLAMTEAANACAEADCILVLGTNFYDSMVRFCLSHYEGDKLILISKHEHFRDRQADIVIHDEVQDVLPKLV